MQRKKITTVVFIFLLAGAVTALSQTKQRVRFAPGTSGATVKGAVRGFAYRDYVIRASAGQTIDTRIISPKIFSVLTIFLPDGDNLEGAVETDEFTGELPVNGDYVIRVMMMRAEARRPGSISNFTLKISIR